MTDQSNGRAAWGRFVGFLIGLAMIAAGCWIVYPPAALIAPGVILVAATARKG